MNALPLALITVYANESARDLEVDLWRGQFINEFALVEACVSEALAQLASVASEGRNSLLPYLTGQRLAALQSVVCALGPLGVPGVRVSAILTELQTLRHFRNFLCHGAAEVTFHHRHGWQATFHLVTFRNGTIERSSKTVTNIEAACALARLRSARVRLEGQLKGLLATFARR